MAMYFNVYQAVCYDADSVLEEGGPVKFFVLVRCMYGLLRSAASSQVRAGRRSAGSYSRLVQIDGDAVSMTDAGYPKLQGLGEEGE